MMPRPPIDPVKTGELQALIATPCVPELAQRAMELVREGADAKNVRTNTGDTLLHWLVAGDVLLKNVKEIVELVDLHPEMRDVENEIQGWTPVHQVLSMSCRRPGMLNGQVPATIVELLLSEQNLHKTMRTRPQETLMHVACYWGNLAAVQLLHRKGLSLTALAEFQRTVLYHAVASYDFKLVEWLLTHADVVGQINLYMQVLADDGGTVLHAAASRGCDSIAKLLVDKGAIIDLVTTKGKKRAAQLIPDALVVDFDPILFATTSNDKCRFMKAHIQNMQRYGEQLRHEGALKGQMIIDLATQLTGKIDDFFALPPDTQQAHANAFKGEFIRLLNSKNNEMQAYRVNWETIVKNIVIALTGIGIVAIVAQLVHSKWTQGRALFFWQQEQTNSEEGVAEIEQSVNALFPGARSA